MDTGPRKEKGGQTHGESRRKNGTGQGGLSQTSNREREQKKEAGEQGMERARREGRGKGASYETLKIYKSRKTRVQDNGIKAGSHPAGTEMTARQRLISFI